MVRFRSKGRVGIIAVRVLVMVGLRLGVKLTIDVSQMEVL